MSDENSEELKLKIKIPLLNSKVLIKNFINKNLEKKKSKVKEVKIKNPLPKYIFLSLITIVLSIPIFALQYTFEISLLIPILILFFTLASIWLIRILSFVTISIYLLKGKLYSIRDTLN